MANIFLGKAERLHGGGESNGREACLGQQRKVLGYFRL